jgi:hypothetical protein
MNNILYIFNQDGSSSQWWVNVITLLWANSKSITDFHQNKNGLLSKYNATHEEHYGIEFLEFQSEEYLTLFLLKFS